MSKTGWLIVALCIAASGFAFYQYGRGFWMPVYVKLKGRTTVDQVVARIGEHSESKHKPRFASAGIAWPPTSVTLLATKKEKQLEVWASDGGAFQHIHTYPVLKTSGVTGPKLKEGDRQVPEGIYRVIGLNPNSAYHLSMKLDYPNQFDQQHANAENRTEPGSNIFIHGKAKSIGCLAMGDETIEELFVLAATVGIKNFKVVIAPQDPRKQTLTVAATDAPWVADLYGQIDAEFSNYGPIAEQQQ